jgi:hypothetical protein
MKRTLLTAFTALMLFGLSCNKQDKAPSAEEETTEIGERKCASQEVLEAQMSEDPGLRARMEQIESFTKRFEQTSEAGRTQAITIPVVVHVVYNTTSQNISAAQIQSQIDVLNEDFNLTNPDNTLVPAHFAGVKANVGITFTLSQVVRKQTSKRSFRTDDGVKFASKGGSDAIEPTKKLNIWVCNLSNGILGYAQFPGGSTATDGVVCLYSAFGSRLKTAGTYVANYDKGRTATHEVGHWLNLRHIWGDATCGNDFVGDTPQHNTSNGGCPPADHKSTCTGTPLEMWMNYMDYTYDACMYMFSTGQKTRMDAVFASGGPRASFLL